MTWFWETAQWWWEWMLAMSVQVAVLALVVAVVDRIVIRWMWPQLLAALWLLVFVKLVIPPTFSSPVSLARFVLWPAVSDPMVGANATQGTSLLPGLALAVWFVVSSLLAARLVWQYHRLRALWLGGPSEPLPPWLERLVVNAAAQLELRGRVRVQIRRGVGGPAVVGFLRPVVVLPRDLVRDGSPRRIRHVLLHELAHVKRRDPQTTLVCLVLLLIYWYHPCVWLARRRLSTLREVCCDQSAAATLAEPSEYWATLLHFARPLLNAAPPGRLAFIHPPSQLLTRLQWSQRPIRRGSRRRSAVTAVIVGFVAIGCVPLARPTIDNNSSVSSSRQKTGDPADSARKRAQPVRTVVMNDATTPLLADLTRTAAFDELPGCLPRRFIILAMLARQESSAHDGQEIE